MTNKVKEAIEALQALPDDKAERIADAVIDAAAANDKEYQLSDEQVREIERRLADPSPRYITLAELRKRLRSLGV
jgi:hypothetical protein